MKLKPLYAISLAAIYGFAFTPTNFAADESDNSRALEVIIVTATKRAESLMDIPVSVSAISGAKIADQGIQDLNAASAYVPGFNVQPSPIADSINIRGIQSGDQAGFEQSVSTFVDGVYRGRGVQSRFAFLDVGLLEVLRGPQGTLFGKNTVGGALNISSAKPTPELSAAISAKYNLEFEETEINGHLSGPLSDNLFGRVAFVSKAMDKGWVENTTYAENNPVTDEFAFRGILEYDMNESTSLTLRAETGTFDNSGSPWDLINSGPALESVGIFGSVDNLTQMGNTPDYMEAIFGPGSAGNTAPVDFGSVSKMKGDVSEYAFTLNHELDNGGDITAIVATSVYDFKRFLDADFNPLPILRFDDSEDFEQNSVEIRYASPEDQRASFITGLYWQDSDLYVDGHTTFNTFAIDNLTTAGCLLNGGIVGTGATPDEILANTLGGNLVAGNPVGLTRTCVNAAVTGLLTDLGLEGFSRYASLDQKDTVKAVFGELKFDVTDTFTTKLGLRYTEEVKIGKQGVFASEYGTRNRIDNPAYDAALFYVGEGTAHSFDLERDESSLTWSVNGSWFYSDDAMFYGSASTGFKAGGFNSFAFRTDPAEAEVDEEDALSFELGGKFTLADGAAEVNVALFRSEFDNLQASLFAGSTSFIVQNAAEATSQGLEIDGRWQATDNLMLTGSAAFIDFAFDRYPNAGCNVDQLITLREGIWSGTAPVTGIPNFLAPVLTLQDCTNLGINNLAGQTSENTPEFAASLGLNHTANLNGFEIISNLDLNYQGEQYRTADLDPLSLDEASLRINASLTLGKIDGNWDVSLIANNLTDKTNINFSNDTPLFEEARQIATMPPRSLSLRFRYHY